MNKQSAVLEKIDSLINPITVKELRQIVRSYFFQTVYIIVLLLLSLIINNVFEYRSYTSIDSLTPLLVVLPIFVCGGVVPLLYGFRFGAERTNKTDELMYITSLSSAQIISGKILSAVLVDLFLISAFAPFITSLLFFKGVSYCYIIFCLVATCVISLFLTVLQISLASMVNDPISYNFYRLFAVIIQLYLCFSSTGAIASQIHKSRLIIGNASFFTTAASIIFIIFAIAYFLQKLGASAISLKGFKKAVQTKYLSVGAMVVGCCLIICFYIVGYIDQRDMSELAAIWFILTQFAVIGLALAASCEPSGITSREVEEIPKNSALRFLSFFFYKGSAGTLGCCIIMMLVSIIGVLLMGSSTLRSSRMIEYIVNFSCMSLLAISYSLFTSLIWRRIFKEKIPVSYSYLITLVLLFLGILVPEAFSKISGSSFCLFDSFNPFKVFRVADGLSGITYYIVGSRFWRQRWEGKPIICCVVGVCLFMLLISGNWLFKQFTSYMSKKPSNVPEPDKHKFSHNS